MDTLPMASTGIFLPNRPRPAAQAQKTTRSSSHPRLKRPATAELQFIHVARPSETNPGQRLSLIRSHAAKQVHALRRNNQGYLKEALCGGGGGGSSSYADAAFVRNQDSTATVGVADASAGSERSQQVVRRKQRTTWMGHDRVPSPIQVIGGSVKDCCRGGFARTLSHDEYRLFEYYTQWVLKYGFEGCVPAGMETYFFKAHTTSLLPFTMARPGLLSGMLYIAARRLSLNTHNASDAHELTFKMLHYRLKCLESMKEAVGKEFVPTDETITLGMMMCSEAYREGDQDATRAHAQAVFQMVTTRGGLRAITALSGFLEFLLATSIWDPRYKMLTGPYDDDEH